MYEKLSEAFQIIEKKQKEIRGLKDVIREYEQNSESISFVTEQNLENELIDSEKAKINAKAKDLEGIVFYDKVKMDKQKGNVPIIDMRKVREKVNVLKSKAVMQKPKVRLNNSSVKLLKSKQKVKSSLF